MNRLEEFLSGLRKVRGMSSGAAIIIAIVVLVLAWSLVKRLIGVAFTLLHWAIGIAVLVVVVLLVVLAIKYLAKKIE